MTHVSKMSAAIQGSVGKYLSFDLFLHQLKSGTYILELPCGSLLVVTILRSVGVDLQRNTLVSFLELLGSWTASVQLQKAQRAFFRHHGIGRGIGSRRSALSTTPCCSRRPRREATCALPRTEPRAGCCRSRGCRRSPIPCWKTCSTRASW